MVGGTGILRRARRNSFYLNGLEPWKQSFVMEMTKEKERNDTLVVVLNIRSLTPTETWSCVVCVFRSWTSRTNVHQTHIAHAEVQCVWTMCLYRALRNVSIVCVYTYLNMYNAHWTSVLHVLCGLPNRQCKKTNAHIAQCSVQTQGSAEVQISVQHQFLMYVGSWSSVAEHTNHPGSSFRRG